jgi:hypothetical protein
VFAGLHSRIGFSINDNAKNNVVLKNNMFIGDDASHVLLSLPNDLSQIELDHNLYYDSAGGNIIAWNGSGYGLLSDFSSNSNEESNGVQGDPSLNNNYSLSAASTLAINSGADLAGIVNYDIAGNSRPQESAWDIGAYEYISGTPVYQCNDGVDNDVDGKTDYPDDPGCLSPTGNDESSDCPGGNCQGANAAASTSEDNQGTGEGASGGGCFLSTLF